MAINRDWTRDGRAIAVVRWRHVLSTSRGIHVVQCKVVTGRGWLIFALPVTAVVGEARIDHGSTAVVRREVVAKFGFLGEFFALVTAFDIVVLLAADDDGVDGDEDGESAGQNALDDDENNAGDGSRGLGDSEFLGEDQDARNRDDTDDSDENINDVTSLAVERTADDEEAEENQLAGKLTAGLDETVSATEGNDGALGEEVDDERNKHPPESRLVLVVEETILA